MKVLALKQSRYSSEEIEVEVPTNSTKEAVLAFKLNHPDSTILEVNSLPVDSICDGCSRPIMPLQSHATARDEATGEDLVFCIECIGPYLGGDII